MNDFLEFQKIWFDNEISQLSVFCSTEILTISSKIYVTDELIDELVCKIEHFINGKVRESYWANEQKGDNSTACVSLRFIHKDKLGHILVEVYMELDDGGNYSRHNCCFFLNTEIGLLETFCKKLPAIKQNISGIKITLNK